MYLLSAACASPQLREYYVQRGRGSELPHAVLEEAAGTVDFTAILEFQHVHPK